MGVSLKTSPSLLAKDIEIKGDVISKGFIEIEGRVSGNVHGKNVTIRESAKIEGDLQADLVNVKGFFKGSICARVINISGEAKIIGTIEYHSLSVEDGATIDGQFKQTSEIKWNDEKRCIDRPSGKTVEFVNTTENSSKEK